MRSATLIGFVFLASPVRTVPTNKNLADVVMIVFIAAMLMDVCEFVIKVSKRK